MLAFGATQAHAEPDESAPKAAHALASEARKAYEGGNYARAAELYRLAGELVHAPSLSVREGQSFEKLGRLVEASEAFRRTIEYPLTKESPRPFRIAVEKAQRRLTVLRPKVPKLTLLLASGWDHRPDVTVLLDGIPIPKAAVGVPIPVNPGSHEVIARRRGAPDVKRSITLRIGETASLSLAPETAPLREAPRGSGRAPDSDPPLKLIALVVGGAGVVGLGVGIAAGAMAEERHGNVVASCPGNYCLSTSHGAAELDAFRALRTASTVGYVVGILGLGTGCTLWLLSPERSPFAVTMGPTSLTLKGRF